MDLAYGTNRPSLNPLADGDRALLVGCAEQMRRHPSLPGRVPGQSGFGEDVCHGLVADHVLPLAHGGDSDSPMQMLRCHDVHSVQFLLSREHFAKIGIRSTFFGGCGGARSFVVAIDDLSSHLPTAQPPARTRRPGRIFKEFAYLLVQLSTSPLRVVVTPSIRITDRRDAQFLFLQGRQELAETLSAATHIPNVNSFVGGHKACSSQHVARYYRGRRGYGGSRPQELSSG